MNLGFKHLLRSAIIARLGVAHQPFLHACVPQRPAPMQLREHRLLTVMDWSFVMMIDEQQLAQACLRCW